MSITSGFSARFCGGAAVYSAIVFVVAHVCCGQTVDSSQDTIYARSGDVVTLPCNQTLPAPSPDLPFVPFFLQWHRQDLPYPFYVGFAAYPPYVDPQYADRAAVQEDLSLLIDGVVAEDDGWYECQVIVLTGNYEDIGNGTFVRLVIIGPPRFLSTPPPLVVVREGKTAALRCVAKGTPTPAVTWRKDGRPLPAGERLTSRADTLEFAGVRREDSGTYVCRAQSEEGAVQHTVRLLVHGAPFIFIPPHNLTVVSGRAAIFECEAEASPGNATQRWYDHRGNRIRASSLRYDLLPEGGLMIRGVSPRDEGWYACSPTNGLGQAPVAEGYLDVQYPAVVVAMPTDAYISRGSDVTLPCPADADPPLLEAVWRRDGVEIASRRSDRYRVSDDGSLTIRGAGLGDSGAYTCTPFNAIGTAGESTPTVLTVRDPPQFVTRPKSLYQRLLGEDVNIPCTASGDPTPTIVWIKVNGELPQLRSSVAQGSLTIRGLIKEDHGTYRCLATNQIAAVVSTLQLIVELTSPHEPYNVTIATTISSARVAWQPAYNGGFTQTYTVWYLEVGVADKEWSKFDRIPEDVNSYIVHDLRPATEYLFAVVASNQVGDSLFSATVSARTKDMDELVSPTDETGKTLIPIYIGLTPSPPQNLTLTPSQEGLRLAWYPPARWGQFVSRYSVEYRLGGPWVILYDRVGADRSDRVLQGLRPNATYQFRMFAFTPVLYSSPSEVVTGFTGDIPAYMEPNPTTDHTPRYGEPGVLAGVIAGICFLLVVLLLSVLAVCVSHRRKTKKKKKRLAFFSVAAQTPQPLIHRPHPAQSPETPVPAPAKPPGLVSKLILKISPRHGRSPAPGPAPYSAPNRRAHLTSNGKLPSARSEPSLSERLLSRPARGQHHHHAHGHHGRSSSGGGRGRRRLGGGADASGAGQLASEQALELEEFEPSSLAAAAAAGVYSVRDGRIRTHGFYSYDSYPYGETSEATRDDEDSDGTPDVRPRAWPTPGPPDEGGSPRPLRGDYVYYHGNMFITSNSDDDEDYGWAGGAEVVGGGAGGVVNRAMVADDSRVPAERRPAPARNQYVDMPARNDWQWDREWAEVTLSDAHSGGHHETPEDSSATAQRTLPRQSTRKNVGRLSRDDIKSGPLAEYSISPPWSDSISTIQGNSVDARHADLDYGEPRRTESRRGRGDYDEPQRRTGRSPARRTSPRRTSPSPDYDRLRSSPRRRSPQRVPSYGDYGEPSVSVGAVRQPSPHYGGTPKRYGTPLAARGPKSPRRQDGCPANATNRPRPDEGRYDCGTGARCRGSERGRRSPTKAGGDGGPESERYRKPAQQVTRRSPERTKPAAQGRADSRSEPRTDPGEGRGGATPAESCADTDTLQGTFREGDSMLTDCGRNPGDAAASPTAVRKAAHAPAGAAKPKLQERASPQGGTSLPLGEAEGDVGASVSPAAASADGRASASSLDSRPGSAKPAAHLPQSYIAAHQRSLLSPASQCSGSSGYASRNTSQSTSSRGRTSSVPSIQDPTSSAAVADGVDSPFADSAGPFSNVSSKESEEPYFEFDPVAHERALLDALRRYYQPVEVPTPPADGPYEEGTGKVADMEKRCEELKKEFQEYQRQQARAKRKSRITSSV